MDVVVDGHLILSQAKKNEESKRQNIVAQREFDESGRAFLTSAGTSAVTPYQRVESNCEVVSLHTSDTTRRTAALERNDPVEANSFAVETDNFSSSPLMVQLNFFERSH